MFILQKFWLVSIFFIIPICAFSALSASGDLDLSFNQTGKVRIGFGFSNDEIAKTAIQSDGKIIAVGVSKGGFAVARYNPNGLIDSSFGKNGRFLEFLNTFDSFALSVAIQTDGKIVVAGYSLQRFIYNDFAVIRLNPNGSLDNTFGTNGIVKTTIGNFNNVAYSIAIQSDGKIVVAGFTSNGIDNSFAVVRYNSNGTLDTTFGINGIVVTQIETGDDFGLSVIIQPDNKIVVAGIAEKEGDQNFAVVRYNSNGLLDNSFDNDGIVTTEIGNDSDAAYSLAIQSDGKLIAVGASFNGSDFDFALVRYQTDGKLDTSFDNDGKLTTQIGNDFDEAFSVVIQSDNKILVGGRSATDTDYDFAVVRYNSNGSIDTSFDTDGKVTTAIGIANDEAFSIILQTDGKIIAAGSDEINFEFGSTADFALARYNSDGSLDNTFNVNGIATTDIDNGFAAGRASIIQPDGKIVIAGYNNDEVTDNFAVVRLHSNGTIDTNFGINGKVITRIGRDAQANTISIQADGKILVAGYAIVNSGYDFAIVRYNSDGSLDNTFGNNGKVTTQVGVDNEAINSVAVQNDGKIVAVGYAFNGSNFDFAVVRYNSNGSLDNSFDNDGKVLTPIGVGSDIAFSVTIQIDGKIVVGGDSVFNELLGDFAIVRYNSNGSLDNSFSDDGKTTTSIGANYDRITSLEIQNDGKIIAAGYGETNPNIDFAMARYNSNGTLDNSFDVDGKTTTSFGTDYDYGLSIALQSDGKILTAGSSNINSEANFAIARFNTNGSLDGNFAANSGGRGNFDLSGNFDRAFSTKIDSIGRIVLVGESDGLFGVVRLQNELSPNATANLGGKVLTSQGRAIPNARITISTQIGFSKTIYATSFGSFNFDNLPVGESYTLQVSKNGYQFINNTITYQLNDNFDGIRFIGNLP